MDGDLDLVFPGVSALAVALVPKTLLRASSAAFSFLRSSCICSMDSNFSSADKSVRSLINTNSASAPVSTAFSDDLGSGDIGTGCSDALVDVGRQKFDPSPRCETSGALNVRDDELDGKIFDDDVVVIVDVICLI